MCACPKSGRSRIHEAWIRRVEEEHQTLGPWAAGSLRRAGGDTDSHVEALVTLVTGAPGGASAGRALLEKAVRRRQARGCARGPPPLFSKTLDGWATSARTHDPDSQGCARLHVAFWALATLVTHLYARRGPRCYVLCRLRADGGLLRLGDGSAGRPCPQKRCSSVGSLTRRVLGASALPRRCG